MPADLDDLCDRTRDLEQAIGGKDGLTAGVAVVTTQLSEHVRTDEDFRKEARDEWTAARAERTAVRDALVGVQAAVAAAPRGPSLTAIAAIATAATGLVGAAGTAIAMVVGAATGHAVSAPPPEPVHVEAPAPSGSPVPTSIEP